MLRSYPLSLIWTVTVGLVTVPAVAQGRVLCPDDMRALRMIGDLAVAPAGDRVVVTIGTMDFDENEIRDSLELIDIASGETRRLAPHRDRVRDPAWSPDGTHLAFQAPATEGDGSQVFVLPMAGGEARQVTRAPTGVEYFQWSADGDGVFYASRDPAPQREGAERHNRSFEVGDHSYLTQAAPRPVHLWQQALAGGEPRRLTAGAESVNGFRVSPDGKALAVNLRPSAETGVREQQVVKLLDLATAELRGLGLSAPASVRAFSPDGRHVVVDRPRGAPSGYSPGGLTLVPVAGGPGAELGADVDREFGGLEWLPGGRSALLTGVDGTRSVMWQVFVDGSPSQRVALAGIEIGVKESTQDGRLVFVGDRADRPQEVYVTEIGSWQPRRLTNYNGAFDEIAIGRTEAVEWKGPEGRVLSGTLRYPSDYRAGQRYPLVLRIHGGPMSNSTERFDFFEHCMAARGWLVFSPNYRGSDNMGLEFQSAVLGDPADGPARDIMSGVAHLRGRGLVDERRMAVSGWSYGGFMTTWLAAHHNVWTAAVAGAAVTDWFDAYNLADITDYFRTGMGGSPWVADNAENYRRWSPITYAHLIEAPTLILCNTGDARVPITQSYKLYRALKDSDVEVRFIAYPVGGHTPSDPVHRRDVLRRWIDWIETHFAAATRAR